MSKRKRLTAATIDHVWSLYNLGYSYNTIAAKLNISATSVQRCIIAMQLAAAGEVVRYEGLLKDSHYIADYANQRFNTSEVSQEVTDADLVNAVNKLADNIAKQTALIESFMRKLESRV